MNFRILIGFLLVSSAKAQYETTIPCQSADTCRNLLNPSQNIQCIAGLCMCANSTMSAYIPCSNKDIMLSAMQRGMKRNCSHDNDCLDIHGALCYDEQAITKRRVCDCQPHLLMSTDGKQCLPVATELGSRCVELAQCTSGLDGAECVEGKCRCRTNFHYTESKRRCIQNREYGDACRREDESCFQLADGVNALGCSEKNICKCKKNYVYVGGLCQHSGASRTILGISLVFLILPLINRML